MVRMLALALRSRSRPHRLSRRNVESTQLPPYGPVITLDQAKRVMAAAELEAAENSWQVAITILDSGGNLVMFHKFDNAQLSAVSISQGKAQTALQFKRPSKDLDDAIARGEPRQSPARAQGHYADRRRAADPGRRQDRRLDRRLRRHLGAGQRGRQGRHRGAGEVRRRRTDHLTIRPTVICHLSSVLCRPSFSLRSRSMIRGGAR